jgi:AraC-like DNA-binding protein
MKLYIKNMVCDRCKMVVTSELEKLGLTPIAIDLGEVQLQHEISAGDKKMIGEKLGQYGFSLINDKKSRQIEKIKSLIVDLVHYKNGQLAVNLSDYLSGQMASDYPALSRLFSEVEGVTIEKYFIAQRIERAKELLVYDEMSLTEIADHLNYSSVAHLSSQFKKMTGFTPSYYKQVKEKKRSSLDNIQML